jgi:DNA-binding transcriptional MerR regulator
VTDDPTWTIAQMADDFDVTHRALRHYEHLGLLAPEREGQRRIYHRRERTRLALILRGRRLGFPLEEVATILDMYDDQPGEAGQLRYLLSQIDDRRTDLERRRRDVEDSLRELDDLERRCEEDLTRLS